MLNHKYFILSLLLFVSLSAYAQPANDECNTAIMLPNVDKYCSDKEEYTIVGATPSGFGAPSCWLNGANSHDVWFSFIARKTSARITVIGRNRVSGFGGTLNEPELAVYSGRCGGLISQLECETDQAGNNIVEAFQGQLTIGETYLIRVDARSTNTGTFQICVDQTNPPIEADADCITGAVLCDKESILVAKTVGQGNDPNEMNGNCFGGTGEFDSKWFKWTCKTAGTLEFTITPNNEPDDIDFVVLELPNGLSDCTGNILLRCMASGDFNFPSRCMGPTGLKDGNNDTSEPAGCNGGSEQNNFIAPLDMEVGKSYALGISNFSQSGSGYTIDFGGTGEFQGPEPNFSVDPLSGLKCDQVFTVTDASFFGQGQIVSWEWNFGTGAVPATANSQGPHQLNYVSFGTKTITLTVTTDRGCVVTLSRQIEVEPCCEDLEDLIIRRDSTINPRCAGEEEGKIFVSASGGSPFYEFSMEGGPFIFPGSFDELGEGVYEIVARDSKGCLDTIDVTIIEPDPLIVNAGPDQTIKLGDCTYITGRVTPIGSLTSYNWMGGDTSDIMCDTCPRTKVFPTMGTTTFVISVRDSMGCESKDSVTIFVEEIRPYFAPNVITVNGDGLNDIFTIFGGNGLRAIITLEVYDRWGELVYKGENFPPGEEGIAMGFGWNGYFHDEPMNPAVFAFKADLEYIDDVVISVVGNFTILR